MKKYVLFIMTFMLLFSAFCLSANAEDALLFSDSCENELSGVTLMEGSVDGSKFYRCDNGVDLGFLPYETSSDFLYELDIRFNKEGCGFSFMKKGKWNSCIRIKDGHLALQTGGNSFQKLCPIELDKWYHFTFLGRTNRDANPVTYGHIVLEEYENGNRVNKQVFKFVNLRNNAATHYINAFGGCDIDNLAAYTPSPTKIELLMDAETVVAGNSVQFTPSVFYNELEMPGVNKNDITFSVHDAKDGYVLEDENITIDENGLLTTNMLTPSGEICVKVTSKSANLSAEKTLKIMSNDVFTVTGVGVNETGTVITEISVKKNFAAYKDTVSFAVAFYNPDGSFKCVDFKPVSGNSLSEGDNKVKVNINVPVGFNVYTDKMAVYSITAFGPVNDAVKVKYDNLPMFEGGVVILSVKDDCDVTKIKGEDILYFDVVYPQSGKIQLPQSGRCYVMGSVERLDTLFEIEK